jgi:hypothetical protein
MVANDRSIPIIRLKQVNEPGELSANRQERTKSQYFISQAFILIHVRIVQEFSRLKGRLISGCHPHI